MDRKSIDGINIEISEKIGTTDATATDELVIEQIKNTIALRNHVPSRKLWQCIETLMNQEYEITKKQLDEKIQTMKKQADAVTLTCSTRFKVKLDMVDYILGA